MSVLKSSDPARGKDHPAPTIVWLRLDLRLTDQPALYAARERGGPVIPVFIWAPEEEAPWEPGAASRWWLHRSLADFQTDLAKAGCQLILRQGRSLDQLQSLIDETGADAVYWNRRYEPALIARDTQIKQVLTQDGLEVESFNSALLFEPWDIRTATGGPYQVYSPFWRACLKVDVVEPLPELRTLPGYEQPVHSVSLDDLGLLPNIPWYCGMAEAWEPGAAGAARQLRTFLQTSVEDYTEQRNRPDRVGTSRLSPHLHFGEISPRTIWQAVVNQHGLPGKDKKSGADMFLSEVVWREFAHHLLFHFPHTTDQPLRERFSQLPWRNNAQELRAWQRGRTGFPMVDAGMRELWSIGWMHNRVRMIVASFLTKDLLIPWQEGARWFWDTLVDADLASNTLGWQWTAGCGADAAPYFRVFNPTSQGEKFDPAGDYVRRWIPELSRLAGADIHRARELAPRPPGGYPAPLVDHALARDRALEAYEAVKDARS